MLVSVILIGTANVSAQKTYLIQGQLSPEVQGTIYLDYDLYTKDSTRIVLDSTMVKDGRFEFRGKIMHPTYVRLIMGQVKTARPAVRVFLPFYLEPGVITVNSKAMLNKGIVFGSKASEEFAIWWKQWQPLTDSINSINLRSYKLESTMDTAGIRILKERGALYAKRRDQIDSIFVATHPGSKVAFDIRFRRLPIDRAHLNEVEAALGQFNTSVKQIPQVRSVIEKLAVFKQLQAGKVAPAFTLTDLSGKQKSLSDYKGHYLLLSFARYTEFGLKRMGLESLLRNLSNAQAKLKADNFSVLTILSDKNIDMAKAVIQENGLNWTHLTGDSVTAKAIENAYGISYGNDVFLIGPDGHFIKTDIQLNEDIAAQIKMLIPGAENSINKDGASSKSVSADESLNVYLGEEIKEYPKVEWLKGAPVTHFSKDTIYVVELWATWCVPCIAAMPHLSALQRKFKDKKVVVIAQQVWEDDKTKVLDFLKNKGEELNCRVAFSGPAGSDFDLRWCKPAQVASIPRTFVIQDGKLVWQTYPTMLNDANLQLLVDKKFTIGKAEALSRKQ